MQNRNETFIFFPKVTTVFKYQNGVAQFPLLQTGVVQTLLFQKGLKEVIRIKLLK